MATNTRSTGTNETDDPGVSVRALARELLISDHDCWLLAAELIREGGWSAVFAHGTVLTEPAEKAIREHIRGVTDALRKMCRGN